MQQDMSVADRRLQLKQLLESFIQRDHGDTEAQQLLQQQKSSTAGGGRGGGSVQHHAFSSPPLADDRLYR